MQPALTSPSLALQPAVPWSLEEMIAPIKPGAFFKNYLDQRVYHGRATHPQRFDAVMSWELLSGLLSIPNLWTRNNLQLFSEGSPLDPSTYCQMEPSQQGPIQRPSHAHVMAAIEQGASLVCSEIEGTSPTLRSIAKLFQEHFRAKVQANLYLSWPLKQAFKSHFDTHDVWVFQTSGTKKWNLYQGRYDAPLSHPAFKQFGQAYHDQAKGKLDFSVTLQPGDLLYIPRGVYHDALAATSPSMHVTFGITRPLGMDLLSLLFERALHESFFRQVIPLESSALKTHMPAYLKQFAQNCSALLESADFEELVSQFQQQFANEMPEYTLTSLTGSEK